MTISCHPLTRRQSGLKTVSETNNAYLWTAGGEWDRPLRRAERDQNEMLPQLDRAGWRASSRAVALNLRGVTPLGDQMTLSQGSPKQIFAF